MFKPLGDRVLIRPLQTEKTTASGLVLPDSAKKESQEGEILAVGNGLTDDGKQLDINAMGLRVGVKVMFEKYGPDEIELNGEELKVAKVSQIIGLLDNEAESATTETNPANVPPVNYTQN